MAVSYGFPCIVVGWTGTYDIEHRAVRHSTSQIKHKLPFPVAVRHYLVTDSASNPPRQSRVAVMSFKILIVDDNVVIRRMLRTSLEQTPGWEVCGEAENGKVAVDK